MCVGEIAVSVVMVMAATAAAGVIYNKANFIIIFFFQTSHTSYFPFDSSFNNNHYLLVQIQSHKLHYLNHNQLLEIHDIYFF